MQSENQTYQIYNYTDIFSKYFFNREDNYNRPCPEYALIFVFSGELVVCNGNCEKTISKRGYIFLRKDKDTILNIKSFENEPFSSICMGFSHNFLYKFYQSIKKKEGVKFTENFPLKVIELPRTPYLESMYVSLLPYLSRNVKPMEQIVEIKLMEAVFSLLLTDERFYPYLFDFSEHSQEENIAVFDDSVIQDLCAFSGQLQHLQCLLFKKLETAYVRMQHESKATNIYMEVGYKNVTHLIKSFQKPYDYTPPN